MYGTFLDVLIRIEGGAKGKDIFSVEGATVALAQQLMDEIRSN